MTDNPRLDFKPGTKQLGKHDLRAAPPSDFEVVHADELSALRWVRANREAVEALVAGRAAVVPTPQQGGVVYVPNDKALDISTGTYFDMVDLNRLDVPEGYL